MFLKKFNMLCMYKIVAAFSFFSIIDALAIRRAQILSRPSLSLSQPLPFSSAPSALQVTTLPRQNITLNATNDERENVVRSDCNEAMYGKPAVSSCLNVYRQMTDSDTLSDFGDRTRGVFTYPLPYRLSSGQ